MRIAINTRFLLSGQLEGMGRFTWEVAKRLVARQPDWDFLFLFDRTYDPQFIPAGNVVPYVVAPPARHPVLWHIWYEWAVPRYLKRYRADLFLSMDNFCSIRTQVPSVLVCHDIAWQHFPGQVSSSTLRFYQRNMPRYLEKASRVISVSDFTKKDLLDHFDLEPAKCRVACNGVSTAFRPLSSDEIEATRGQFSDGAPYFFYVGAIHPRKNVHRLIAAFDQFKTASGSRAKLLLAGRFAWRTGQVKSAWESALHKDEIRFLGFVAEEDLPRLMGSALALTYVSLFEGFGIPLLEAMHAEIPVLTSNTSSMPEVAGEAALLVDPEKLEDITQALQQLWDDEALRARLVKRGKVQREKFNWEKATDVVEEAILSALGS